MYGASWTGARVRARLVWFFRHLPGHPIYSPAKNAIEPLSEGVPIDGINLIIATSHCLGRESERRARLLGWARARAHGQSTSEFCRQMSCGRDTIYNTSRDVADWLNARSESATSAESAPSVDNPTVRRAQRSIVHG